MSNTLLYFTDGNAARCVDFRSTPLPLEHLIEPHNQPFFLAPAPTKGMHHLFQEDGAHFRKVIIGPVPAPFYAQPVPVYTNLKTAVEDLSLQSLPTHRSNLESFLNSVTSDDFKLDLASPLYSATLYFHAGGIVASKLSGNALDLRGKEALFGIFLLFGSEPLEFTPRQFNLERDSPEVVNAGVNKFNPAALPACSYVVWNKLASQEVNLAESLFNVRSPFEKPERVIPHKYAVGITEEGSRVGVLLFDNGAYLAGRKNNQFGDAALRSAVKSYLSGSAEFSYLQRDDLYRDDFLARARPRENPLAAVAHAFAQR